MSFRMGTSILEFYTPNCNSEKQCPILLNRPFANKHLAFTFYHFPEFSHHLVMHSTKVEGV